MALRFLLVFFFSVFLSATLGSILNELFQPSGLKINWILTVVLVLSFKYRTALLPFVAILPGFVLDSLSHGILGIYGTSFFLTTLVVYKLYGNTRPGGVLACMSFVFFFSMIEEGTALFLLHLINPELPWKLLLLTPTLPSALLNVLFVPIIFKIIGILEQKRASALIY